MSSPEVSASLVGSSEDVTVSLTPLEVEKGESLAFLGSVGAAHRAAAFSRVGVGKNGSVFVCCRAETPHVQVLETGAQNKSGQQARHGPALRRPRQADLSVPGQPGLHSGACFFIFYFSKKEKSGQYSLSKPSPPPPRFSTTSLCSHKNSRISLSHRQTRRHTA